MHGLLLTVVYIKDKFAVNVSITEVISEMIRCA